MLHKVRCFEPNSTFELRYNNSIVIFTRKLKSLIPGEPEGDIFRKERNISITVYTKPNCVQCNATERAIDKHGLGHDMVDLIQDIDAPNRVKGLGFSQAPVVVAGEDAWSGFRLDKTKELFTTVEVMTI